MTAAASAPPPSSGAPAPCPCGGARRYTDCCARYHPGPQQRSAPDAEALMRSRYSAYVLGLHEYLLATWHSSTRPEALEPHDPALRWLGLEVRRHRATAPDRAEVEFVARSKRGGRAHRLHETSHFVREGGQWFYVDGDLR